MDIKITDNSLLKSTDRKSIVEFESMLSSVDGVFFGDTNICPLKHSFSDGIYVREIFIPAGTVLVGKIHKHDHPNFLMSGIVDVVTEFGSERIEAPKSMISKSGTKRVVHAITDTVWITVHVNKKNITDIPKLEDEIIAKSYSEYDRFIANKGSLIGRVSNYIKSLSK
jgi:hypothetical protein